MRAGYLQLNGPAAVARGVRAVTATYCIMPLDQGLASRATRDVRRSCDTFRATSSQESFGDPKLLPLAALSGGGGAGRGTGSAGRGSSDGDSPSTYLKHDRLVVQLELEVLGIETA